MIAQTIIISKPIYEFVIGPLIPLATGWMTRYTLPGWLKGLLTLFLNFVVAFLTTNASSGTAVFSTQTLYTALIGFALSVATYQAIWSKTPLTSSRPDSKLAPNFGIGKKENPGE